MEERKRGRLCKCARFSCWNRVERKGEKLKKRTERRVKETEKAGDDLLLEERQWKIKYLEERLRTRRIVRRSNRRKGHDDFREYKREDAEEEK